MALKTDNWGQRLRDGRLPAMVYALAGLAALLLPVLLLHFRMGLVISLVVGLWGLALVTARPYAGLLIFLGLLYLRPEEYFPAIAGARATLLVSLLALFAWVTNAFLCRERFLLNLPSVFCFLGFCAVAVGSTLLCGGWVTDVALDMLKLLVLFILIVHLVDTAPRLRMATGALLLFTAILGARTLWNYYHGNALLHGETLRALATGIFGDPNDLALAMAMAMPLALCGIFGGRWRTRLWCSGAVAVLIWTIYVTDSRGGMLALMTALFFYFRRRLGRWGTILGATAILLLLAAGPSRMADLSAQERSAQGRVIAWEAGLRMLQSSPIWGVGKGQFTEHHRLTAHNSLMLCMAELGLVGTFFWLGLFYFVFRDTRRAAGRPSGAVLSTALQISLATFMVGGFFLSRTYTPPLYVYLALAVAAARVEGGWETPTDAAARPIDWLAIAALTLGTVPLMKLLVRLWG